MLMPAMMLRFRFFASPLAAMPCCLRCHDFHADYRLILIFSLFSPMLIFFCFRRYASHYSRY